MRGKYADVIVDIAHEKVDRPFAYRIPEALQGKLEEGMAVTIPFGRGSRRITGYVLRITDEADYAPEKMKEIEQIREQDVPAEAVYVRLAAWMKRQYGSTMIAALKTVLPVKSRKPPRQQRTVVLLADAQTAAERLAFYEQKHQTARARLLRELIEQGSLSYGLITEKLNVTAKTIRTLEEEGLCEVTGTVQYRDPVSGLCLTGAAQEKSRPPLSARQREIVDEIFSCLHSREPGVHLLHGITGSGKTEVYLSLIERVVGEGKQVIVLIPEIALTYQTLKRFFARFPGRVSVMNSRLSGGEKYDQFARARAGEIDVMIGPRSALFTPFPRLGLIVIDEEHESSYKSESMPKYHARETAVTLAGWLGAGVVLGSATPSLESYFRARNGEYRLYRLSERLTGGGLPDVEVVDLRRELREGNRSMFSRVLAERMKERLERGEQTMLFLNRRGYAGFLSCRSCGHVMKCPHCDVSLSEHQGGKLVCHYCGHEEPAVRRCPSCGSPYILGFRAGTQQIEQQVGRLFPGARVLRMDADTTRKKESHEQILAAFANREADVLVGTQMIVKGHDFPNVTLVGILAADLSLAAGDYRAAERTFALLTQAAGRAGRGGKPGQVVIQTYQPGHYSVQYASRQDYEGFYEEEMVYREMMRYPPAAHLLAVQISGKEEAETARFAGELAGHLRREAEREGEELSLMGPASAVIGKLSDRYRFAFYVRSRDYERLVRAKDSLEALLERQGKRGGTVQFDFDPISAY